MAGGPGGTGDGIQSDSLVWAIIMSAFAGESPQLMSELVGRLTWAPSSVRWYPIRVCQSITALPTHNV